MATKRQLADAAHERQEDQRALNVVLDAANQHMEQYAGNWPELRDALARVRARFLTVTPVVAKPEPGTLPGQLSIDGAVAGEPPIRELGNPMAEAFDVPKQCPACGENMLLAWGGSWTPMKADRSGKHPLQCGHCAVVIEVSKAAYEAVLAERRRTIGTSDAKPMKATRGARTRGAG